MRDTGESGPNSQGQRRGKEKFIFFGINPLTSRHLPDDNLRLKLPLSSGLSKGCFFFQVSYDIINHSRSYRVIKSYINIK